MILDIGPGAADGFSRRHLEAKTVLWNGPMGVFEMDAFARRAPKRSARRSSIPAPCRSSAAAILRRPRTRYGFADKMTHMSTGGGATLEYLEGKELPGVAALRNAGRA